MEKDNTKIRTAILIMSIALFVFFPGSLALERAARRKASSPLPLW